MTNRLEVAKGIYAAGLHKVTTTPEPQGQKFPVGSRVIISEHCVAAFDLPDGTEATVNYTYAHAYGGSDVKSYSLNIDGFGDILWFDERHLTLLSDENTCPHCESVYVDTTWVNHSFPYGRGDSAVELTAHVPVHKCLECGEQWLDYVGENLMQEEVNSHTKEKL